MNAQYFIDGLERSGVILSTQNGRLAIDSPAGIITGVVREKLREFKPELFVILNKRNGIDHYDFLKHTKFNIRMIMEGLRLWKEPFDQSDLEQLISGEISQKNAIEYLALWFGQNEDKYKLLVSA